MNRTSEQVLYHQLPAASLASITLVFNPKPAMTFKLLHLGQNQRVENYVIIISSYRTAQFK